MNVKCAIMCHQWYYCLPVWGWACSTRNRWCADCAASGTSDPFGGCDQTEAERVLEISEEVVEICWGFSWIFRALFAIFMGLKELRSQHCLQVVSTQTAGVTTRSISVEASGKKNLVFVHTHYQNKEYLIWPWVKTYGAIFGWMNIYLPSILMFTRVPWFRPMIIYR